MKWIFNFNRFKKIDESIDLPPEPPRIEYIQKSDKLRGDTIRLEDAIKNAKTITEISLDRLKDLERDKEYSLIFYDEFSGEVYPENIELDFRGLSDKISLEDKNLMKIYDAKDFEKKFTGENITIKGDSVFMLFPHGNAYGIIYIDSEGKPQFANVTQKLRRTDLNE